ncbi:PLP-dependent transferase [Pseudovirgaria hyperparasitica]|uniref:alanine--glyoxylate transaminase n=1 Tax=Pseudovirgaria hyperparasitica TaxID=470096 RepID=A0A6A6W7D4_9PEZI|nr:PLP-dependent transferase [Pseudovirgaria hyperparasitica]KAF2758772.1 PLP-dependent transferase [Pseudovirgaria hyperparasitica]
MRIRASHPVLLTPGPIETDDDVLLAMQHYSESHVGQPFVEIFGETLTMLRKVLQTTDPGSQPFIISGSGSLGFDQVATNVLGPKDNVLVLNVGYWGDSFVECLRMYEVEVDEIKAPLGCQPGLWEIAARLRKRNYKAITITHVDTATGVLCDIQSIAALVRSISPDTLIIVDGVCSIGSEDLRFDAWGLDVVIGASQKALGAPAGLSISMVSKRVIQALEGGRLKSRSFYCSWSRWLPIMRNYEAKKPSYFATPPSQLVRALHVSLSQITSHSIQERLQQHRRASEIVKNAISTLGLSQVAHNPTDQAHGMTAFYLPIGLEAEQILPKLARRGAILARGPQAEIAGQYIRFAHMGVSVVDPRRRDIEIGIEALNDTIRELRSTLKISST